MRGSQVQILYGPQNRKPSRESGIFRYFVRTVQDLKASVGTASAEGVARAGPSGARSDGDVASAWPNLYGHVETNFLSNLFWKPG